MALLQCPDCQGEISSEAYVCPRCGRPTEKHAREQKKLKRRLYAWLFGLMLLLAIYEIWLVRRG